MIFTKWDIVEPDLLFIASDQMGILTDKNVQGPPALVVEILSHGTRKVDEGIKLDLFEHGGVRGYWLVDPERDRVTVWRRQPDGSFHALPSCRASSRMCSLRLLCRNSRFHWRDRSPDRLSGFRTPTHNSS